MNTYLSKHTMTKCRLNKKRIYQSLCFFIAGGISILCNAQTALSSPFKLQRINHNIVSYQLNSDEARLAYALQQKHNGSHLVVINQYRHIIGQFSLNSLNHQLAIQYGKSTRIALAEQHIQSKTLQILTPFESVDQAPHLSISTNTNDYTTPTSISLTGGPTLPTGQTTYPLYANGNQQLNFFVNFNQDATPPPPFTDFDPNYFKAVTFHLVNHPEINLPIGKAVCLKDDSGNHCIQSITINQTTNGYSYGQITQGNPSLFHRPINDNSPQVNEFYVSLSGAAWNGTTLQLGASVVVDGSTITSVNTPQSNLSVNATEPYLYNAGDFKLNCPTQNQDTNGFEYSECNLDLSLPQPLTSPTVHSIQPTATQDHKLYIQKASLLSVFGTPGSLNYTEYSDDYWDNLLVYVSDQTLNEGKTTLDVDEIHKYISSQTTNPTLSSFNTSIQFTGTDEYGNPFDITYPLQVRQGKLQP